MIAGSDFRCSEAGFRPPRDACTIDIESSTVTDCGPRGLHIDFGASEARQDERLLGQQQMRAVELGGDMDREIEAAHRRESGLGVRHRDREIAAETDQRLRAPVPDRLDGFDRVMAFFARRLEAEDAVDAVEQALFGTSVIPTVRSPCTLEWPRSGEMPAPSRPILPRSISRLAICCTLPVPCRCWVMPMP